ncbi:MAG: TolC family protein [Dokdonella sp.]
MFLRIAALAACLAVVCVAVPARAAGPLNLDDAFQRVAETHPDLRLFGPRREQLEAGRQTAALKPALVAGVVVENAFGTGQISGLSGAEITLTLASVFERGGKLDARRTLVQSRIDALAVEREGRRLDLLAELARRYLGVIAAQRSISIADTDIAQRKRLVAAAEHRLRAGASPQSVVFAAQAALAWAELDRARAEQRRLAARQQLATLWGEKMPTFDIVVGDPFTVPAIDDFQRLSDLIERTPELEQFVGEQRIREARLQLARTDSVPDVNWQVGVRRLQAERDMGLIGSVSIPLGSSARAAPAIRSAEAELMSLEIERESKQLSLYSTLADAHGRYRVAQIEVERLQDDVVPLLAKAAGAAERAYVAGAASYLELAQMQSELTQALKQRLETALEAQRALIEIQRLTGESFIASQQPATASGVTP